MASDFHIIGNCKQNGSVGYLKTLVQQLNSSVNLQALTGGRLIVLPPVPYLSTAVHLCHDMEISLGAQMVSGRSDVAWTGCYDARMIAEIGGQYVCVGHSERRLKCGETDSLIADQYCMVVEAGLVPILCIGESMQSRSEGNTLAVLEGQLASVFSGDAFKKLPKHDTIIAYEPVWAIGALSAASVSDVSEVFGFLHQYFSGKETLGEAVLCYGGSVDEENCQHFYSAEHVSGLLIGRACMDVDRFIKLIQHCCRPRV